MTSRIQRFIITILLFICVLLYLATLLYLIPAWLNTPDAITMAQALGFVSVGQTFLTLLALAVQFYVRKKPEGEDA